MKQLPEISCAILAGGKSSRMGKDKAFLPMQNTNFLKKLLAEMQDFSDVMVCGKKDSRLEEAAASEAIKARIICDQHEQKGPLEGIRCALKSSLNEYTFFCAVDMPFVTKELPRYLSQFICSDYESYVLTWQGKPEPLCAIYSKKLLPKIDALLAEGNLTIRGIFEESGSPMPESLQRTKYIPLELSPFSKKTLMNINTPKDYFAARKPFVFCVSGFKNSGKTRLILGLIQELKNQGFSCAVIKHDSHDTFSDQPNTDTARFIQAGSLATLLFSEKRFCLNARETMTETALIEKIAGLSLEPDFIIIEGLKKSDFPKIEVLRSIITEKSECKKESLICTASDFDFCGYEGIKNYSANDTKAIAGCIKAYFSIPQRNSCEEAI